MKKVEEGNSYQIQKIGEEELLHIVEGALEEAPPFLRRILRNHRRLVRRTLRTLTNTKKPFISFDTLTVVDS